MQANRNFLNVAILIPILNSAACASKVESHPSKTDDLVATAVQRFQMFNDLCLNSGVTANTLAMSLCIEEWNQNWSTGSENPDRSASFQKNQELIMKCAIEGKSADIEAEKCT